MKYVEVLKTEEIERKYREENPYEKNIMKKLSTITFQKDDEESLSLTSGIRAAEEDDEI